MVNARTLNLFLVVMNSFPRVNQKMIVISFEILYGYNFCNQVESLDDSIIDDIEFSPRKVELPINLNSTIYFDQSIAFDQAADKEENA